VLADTSGAPQDVRTSRDG